MSNFSAQVKKAIKRSGLSLYELAQLFRTAPGTVTRWTNGISAPPKVAQENIIKLISKILKRDHS